MVFNRTSCASRHRRRAFTLVEYLLATSIGLLVLAVALVFWAYASRTCASLLGYVDLSMTSKNALDRISQQIRNARHVQSCSQNRLVLIVPGTTGTNRNAVIFHYDSTNKVLTQTLDWGSGLKETSTLLTECTNFQFSIFQRTPISNSFALRANAWNTNTAKVVRMQWVCVRKLTGDTDSVETQVSANVVIRSQ